jgi:DNA repair protein RadA/Sms
VARVRTVFRCNECGASAPKWVGRCPACGAWNALAEEVEAALAPATAAALAVASAPVPITEVDATTAHPIPTGIGELDRVLGGGLVPGSVTLVGGEPGVGKSTLLTEVAARAAAAGRVVLYVSAEESAQQVRSRAERLGALDPRLWLLAETSLPAIVNAIGTTGAELVIVDSIQTVYDPELGSSPGSVLQVRECAHRLVREAKARDVAVALVGHVTKDGGLAGPRVLEHVVDTVLAFEGERHHALRLLRASKHRFGSTAELGLFEMTGTGLRGVPDPSRLFLADRRTGTPGSVVVATMEGHRPLLVEIQALVAATSASQPRRSAQGVDAGRLALLLAVLDKRLELPVQGCDVYVSAVGGVRLTEPGCDLAIALAVASSALGIAVHQGIVVCGEVGLGGELRQAPGTPRRLAEAARLGFRGAIVPASGPEGVEGIKIHRAGSLEEALSVCKLIQPQG